MPCKRHTHVCVHAPGRGGGVRQSCLVDLGPERKDQRNISEVNTWPRYNYGRAQV